MSVPDLEECRRQFEESRNEAGELTSGLDEARFNWRPGPGEWSIEECLAHLVIVGEWEVRAIEQAIEGGRARGLTGSGDFDYGNIDRYLLHLIEPLARRRLTSPRRFVPLHGQPLTAVVPTFLHLQGRFLEQIEQARGLDLARIKVATPVLRLFRMSLGVTFAAAAAHERRHLLQARRVRERLP